MNTNESNALTFQSQGMKDNINLEKLSSGETRLTDRASPDLAKSDEAMAA